MKLKLLLIITLLIVNPKAEAQIFKYVKDCISSVKSKFCKAPKKVPLTRNQQIFGKTPKLSSFRQGAILNKVACENIFKQQVGKLSLKLTGSLKKEQLEAVIRVANEMKKATPSGFNKLKSPIFIKEMADGTVKGTLKMNVKEFSQETLSFLSQSNFKEDYINAFKDLIKKNGNGNESLSRMTDLIIKGVGSSSHRGHKAFNIEFKIGL